MNLQELKDIINQYKDKIIIKGKQSGKLKNNKLLLQKYKNIFNNISEMIYLVKNYDNLENFHIFCKCGNKNRFCNINRGYCTHCSFKCRSNDTQYLTKQINTKLNNIDENGLNTYQRAFIKSQKTWIKKYNVDNIRKLPTIITKIQQKVYNTMKRNHTYKKSEQEDNCYKLLLNKFNKDDVIRQYKSKEYPFRCDLYIKSLKLYIECHFGQYHHNKPFKNSIEDLEEIEKLKNKSLELNFKGQRKLQYLNIINTWTKRDIRKLQTFKKNKLNYKIFYNIEQFKNWYYKI